MEEINKAYATFRERGICFVYFFHDAIRFLVLCNRL